MSEYTLEIKQIVDYPRCRIYRQFVQALIADRSIRVSGGSGLFYFVVLCSYANFRASYKRIDGISYTIYPANGSCLWRNCPGISAHASAARPWPLWRDCKRKGLSVFLFSDMVSWSNSRFAAGGVTTRFSTTMRPVRRIPDFSSSLYPLPQSWSVPVTARRWTPYWIYIWGRSHCRCVLRLYIP